MNIKTHIDESTAGYKPGLYLRLLRNDDFEIYHSIYSDPLMMISIARTYTEEKSKRLFNQVLKAHESDCPKQLTYAIVNSINGEIMGLVGLVWLNSIDRSEVEVGVMVLPQWRRQKVAHRAKQLIMQSAFNSYEVKIIYACCESDNFAANNANHHLGFTEVGVTNKNKVKNVRAWKLLKSDWID